MLCTAPGNELSAGEIAFRLGLSHHAPVNRELARLAKLLTSAAGVEPPRRPDGSARWWAVVATGRYSDDQHFLWRLRPQLRDAAVLLGLADANPELLYPEVVTGPILEGGTTQITVNAYERSPAARRRCIEHYGTACSVCGFDFAREYGAVGAGVIHVHHIRPLSAIASEHEVDPINDLRPVCPNCHLVIHHREPPFSIEEVRQLLRQSASD
jgi:predicted HNH restriction endonuclease